MLSCFLCGRRGTKGFHEMRWGANKGQLRCHSANACMKRIYAGFRRGY